MVHPIGHCQSGLQKTVFSTEEPREIDSHNFELSVLLVQLGCAQRK